MKAIVTRPNKDGSYDEAGMNNRYVTGEYKLLRNLLKYGVVNCPDKTRIELYHGRGLQGKPFTVMYFGSVY